jgi:eukaryotic-like serine/threonine-protein kinase
MDCPECEFKDLPEEASICPNCGTDVQDGSKSATRITVKQEVDKANGTVIGVQYNYTYDKMDAKDQRNKKNLLEKVKKSWIEGVFYKSVHGAVLIDLGKDTQMSAVERPWDVIVQAVDQPDQTLSPGKKIADVFDEMGKTLLILGAPGSGKTTTLLELARDKIEIAESDPIEPIPVVFNLSSWMNPEQSIAAWLVDELSVKYQTPKRDSSKWIKNNDLFLLLDGLDEVEAVRRKACVEAINKFCQENSADIAVCSRYQEYQELNCRLRLQGAIFLQPLSSEQIGRYIAAGGQKLAALAIALETDTSLQELAKSPLMLSIMSLAYGDLPVGELTTGKMELEVRRKHLFDAYVDRMFNRIGETKTDRFTKKETIPLLSWLAKKMQEHGQTVFLIEQLQPSWLSTRWQIWDYVISSRLICGTFLFICILSLVDVLINGQKKQLTDPSILLFIGILCGLIIALIDVLRYEMGKKTKVIDKSKEKLRFWKSKAYILATWLATASLIGFMSSIKETISGEYGTLYENIIISIIIVGFFILTFGQRSCDAKRDIQTIETLGLSLRGAIQGAALGIILSAIFLGLVVAGGGSPGDKVSISIFSSAILAGMVFGAIRGNISEAKILPNQGIKLSIRNGLLAGLPIGLVFGALYLILLGYSEMNVELVNLILVCTSTGLLASMWYGGLDVIQHYVLRFFLWRDKKTPWIYAKFLDHAVERIFLQRVGGGYIFIHRLFLEYFARREDA